MPTQTSVGTIQGNVSGGHAPIVTSHIFLLEATAAGASPSGYGAVARSLLSASSTATSTTYPVAQDQVTGSVTNGLYYVTSDGSGAFNITGDYSCDIGDPVYLYASAGSPGSSFVLQITAISVTSSRTTYTYTFTASNLLYTGQGVLFSPTSLGGEWATLNGSTQTVLGTPSATSFQISTTIAPGTGTDTQTGSVTTVGSINPAIVNLAMLGVCPSSGNFSSGASAIRYVYMNEVSTVAMAQAMAGFATDSLHIGSSATNLIGLQNAALNAANLYDIQGGAPNTAGHIANLTTVSGNGTVPQAELDTLANILAACVDSANTAQTASSACNTLFTDATSNGTTSGVKPIDTASAAINIALNPGTSNVVSLWSLPSGTIPFSPVLSAQPGDFTVALTYNNIASPGSLALDAKGNAFVLNRSSAGYVTELSPAGAVLATSATGGSGFNSIALDAGGNIFASALNSNALYAYTATLGTVTGSPFTTPTLNAPTSVAVDRSNSVYVAQGNSTAGTVQTFSNTATSTPTVASSTTISNTCLTGISQIALDASGYVWASTSSQSAVCRVSATTDAAAFNFTGTKLSGIGNAAIDSSGNGWVPGTGGTLLFEISSSGISSSFGINHLSGTASPWSAIDGGNNVWVANAGGSNDLFEFNNAGTAITGSSGYQSGKLSNPSAVAIDSSGDVWIPNQTGNSVTEIIGVAVPAVTPLSTLSPGVRP